jgi:hypothetical protein
MTDIQLTVIGENSGSIRTIGFGIGRGAKVLVSVEPSEVDPDDVDFILTTDAPVNNAAEAPAEIAEFLEGIASILREPEFANAWRARATAPDTEEPAEEVED